MQNTFSELAGGAKNRTLFASGCCLPYLNKRVYCQLATSS